MNCERFLNKKEIYEREKKMINSLFSLNFKEAPKMPNWIDENNLFYWQQNLFNVHYMPKISLREVPDVSFWRKKRNRLHRVFYKKIKEGKINENALNLTGKWILIDVRNRPRKKVPWVRSADVRFLDKLGFSSKEYFKKWNKQIHSEEYLKEILTEKGFGSRFCLNVHEINELKPAILEFLKINNKKNIRLPYFIEYNYLANTFYPAWRKTNTWEWLEDKFGKDKQLAGGSKLPGCFGWEPLDFWSTILTFRPVIEL